MCDLTAYCGALYLHASRCALGVLGVRSPTFRAAVLAEQVLVWGHHDVCKRSRVHLFLQRASQGCAQDIYCTSGMQV